MLSESAGEEGVWVQKKVLVVSVALEYRYRLSPLTVALPETQIVRFHSRTFCWMIGAWIDIV
jgi:hypothetical protein